VGICAAVVRLDLPSGRPPGLRLDEIGAARPTVGSEVYSVFSVTVLKGPEGATWGLCPVSGRRWRLEQLDPEIGAGERVGLRGRITGSHRIAVSEVATRGWRPAKVVVSLIAALVVLAYALLDWHRRWLEWDVA
jgi:hypothetical protein